MGEFICFLVGPYGSGKSTVGRMLADFLAIKFVDLSLEVEEFAGQNIADLLLLENGLDVISKVEYQILQDLILKKNIIVEASVNSIKTKENRLLLSFNKIDSTNEKPKKNQSYEKLTTVTLNNIINKGKVIYLATSPTIQYVRSMLSNKTAPSLLMAENKLQYLIKLSQEMGPVYHSIADFIINTDNCLVEEVVNKIIDYLYCSAYC